MLGKAIQSGTKIPVEWHPTYGVPFGDKKNRTTLSSYIGVVAREPVNINYKNWGDVPKEIVDEEYEIIASTLDAQAQRGEITAKGRDDVLAKAINKSDHGGRVRAVGSGVSNKAYFGYNQPTPPNHQFRQFITSGGALGGQGSVSTPFGSYVALLSGQGFGASQFGFPMQGFGGPQFSALNGQLSGSSGQVGGFDVNNVGFNDLGAHLSKNVGFNGLGAHLSKNVGAHVDLEINGTSEPNQEEILPYHVHWPVQHLIHNQFRSGLTRHDPVSVIEHTLLDEKELHIVAKGKVEKRKSEQAITVHNVKIVTSLLRVLVDQVVMPAALMPCPTSEFTYVSQANGSFAPWPSHLIFPMMKDDEQTAKPLDQPLTTPSPETPSSQASTTHKYIIRDEDCAKLTTSLLRKFKIEAGRMKENDECISITIPTSVYGHEHKLKIDYAYIMLSKRD
uniref:DUF8039 domain-containing protein n=1 Tax=Chenopodium quinoa TaxID=63459 RepID=A0A803N3V9_CHEQI